MTLAVVILAAGQGTRMHSQLPKVLHVLGGKPLLEHVIQTALALPEISSVAVVYGHGGELVRAAGENFPITWVHQELQLGTGHAVQMALPFINADRMLVLYGDVPLITADTLNHFILQTPINAIGLLTATLENPTGFGRILRDEQGALCHIIEEKDASAKERNIQEINAGIYILPTRHLANWLSLVKCDNAQSEYYLPDVIPLALQQKIAVTTLEASAEEIIGINDKLQLANCERIYQRRQAEKLLRQGVTLMDPARIDIRGSIEVGRDVTIDINVILAGKVVMGNNCIIGPQVFLCDVTLGDNVEIRANSVVEGAIIGNAAIIGPFARVRPQSTIAERAHVGNFVELKNTTLGEDSKANHLSYCGDSEIGARVNVGAGTITCNYDGANKHRTIIKDDVFIGSDTQLVAPVTVNEGATIGAGSTITRDVPANQLTLCRAYRQISIAEWQRPKKDAKKSNITINAEEK